MADRRRQKLDTMLEPKTPEEARTALDTMADTALVRLFNEQPSAKLLFDKAYGYAVFDSRKFSLMIHTNQGPGSPSIAPVASTPT